MLRSSKIVHKVVLCITAHGSSRPNNNWVTAVKMRPTTAGRWLHRSNGSWRRRQEPEIVPAQFPGAEGRPSWPHAPCSAGATASGESAGRSLRGPASTTLRRASAVSAHRHPRCHACRRRRRRPRVHSSKHAASAEVSGAPIVPPHCVSPCWWYLARACATPPWIECRCHPGCMTTSRHRHLRAEPPPRLAVRR